MIVPRTQPAAQPALSPRLSDRLASLGVTVLSVTADGRATPVGACRWIEQLLIASPVFRAMIIERWKDFDESLGQALLLWPGLSVAPLPTGRRRRAAAERFQKRRLIALFLHNELTHAEQFQAVCDAAGVDRQAASAKLDPRQCVTPEEAGRLAAMLMWMQEDATEIDRRLSELRGLSAELSESYEELSLLYKLSNHMTVNQEPRRFLETAVRELNQVSGLSWLVLRLIDNEPRLEALAGAVFASGAMTLTDDQARDVGGELIRRLPVDGQPLIADDASVLGIDQLHNAARSLLATPVHFEGRTLGVLYGGDKIDGSHISSVDSKLCHSLAGNLSIFLANTMLYDDMQSMFLGTLHALTNAIDAKDSYTHGHSERVALMSRMLAQHAGFEPMLIERIYISGLVHDVGKIGVPESVLCKPGKLTDEEFSLIKMHPEIGARIIEDIRQMQDLVPGVLHHHERWDGRGYPHGLAGQSIPLMGRVIGLADAFDAMSSNRTYRRALELPDVLEEITRCAGQQFDPDLVDAFQSLDFEPFFDLIEKHQHQHQQTATGAEARPDR